MEPATIAAIVSALAAVASAILGGLALRTSRAAKHQAAAAEVTANAANRLATVAEANHAASVEPLPRLVELADGSAQIFMDDEESDVAPSAQSIVAYLVNLRATPGSLLEAWFNSTAGEVLFAQLVEGTNAVVEFPMSAMAKADGKLHKLEVTFKASESGRTFRFTADLVLHAGRFRAITEHVDPT